MCIAVPIYFATKSRGLALLYTLLSSLAEPAGAIITFLFLQQLINKTFLEIIMLCVGSIMINVSIKELLPKTINYKEPLIFTIGIIIGLLITVLNIFYI